MKKALVTGAEGFIGSHLVEGLLKEGYDVRAFVMYNSFNSFGWLDTLDGKVKDNIEVITGDIRDKNIVKKAMHCVDDVYHLAALVGIPYSLHAPESYIDTNIKGTLNVLEEGFDCENIIIMSTSEVYGAAIEFPIKECNPLLAKSPYAASKIGMESLVKAWRYSYDTGQIKIVRPFNNYGPRQSARAIIPSIIVQLLDDKIDELTLGNLTPTRDFVYVKDTAEGLIKIAESDLIELSEVNIATGIEISIEDLAYALMKKVGTEKKINQELNRIRKSEIEVFRLCGDNSFLENLTGWKPKTKLDIGLKKTVDWFFQNVGKYKTKIYNI
jgi:NAD dependent epimerase/dehydratase